MAISDLELDVAAMFEKYEGTGNGIYLLQAIQACGLYRLPIPINIRRALGAVLDRYSSAEARTLDEAFGIKRPKGWNQSSEISKHRDIGSGYSKAYAIWRAVKQSHEDGSPIDIGLFEGIGADFAVSGSTARKYYREVEKALRGKSGKT